MNDLPRNALFPDMSVLSPIQPPRVSTLANTTFTELQGQYLAFIHAYSKIHRCPPAEADLQHYFQVTPPTVHRMIIHLEQEGFISRTPRQSRSIQLLIDPEQLPPLR